MLAAIVVGLYSTQAHKEYRFILPALPLVLIVIAHKVATAVQGREAPSIMRVLGFLILAQLPPAAYFSAYHMSAGQAVMDSLHKELSSNLAANPSAELSVGFLTACHMTPWQAQLHLDIPIHVSVSAVSMIGIFIVVVSVHILPGLNSLLVCLQFPDCSPSKTAGCRGFSDETCAIAQRRWPTKAEMQASPSTDDGTDEMTHMFDDPNKYAFDTYGNTVSARWGGIAAPTHLVMFQPMAMEVAEFLDSNG